jgi:hypothetical protein
LVKELMDRYKDGVLIGYAAIDAGKAACAAAMAISTDSPDIIVGSLAYNPCSYCRVVKHFLYNNDPQQCFGDYGTEKGLGSMLISIDNSRQN